MKSTISTILAALLISGCTSLSTSTDRVTASRSQATTGVPYSLPMLQYEVKITRSLTQCYEPDADGKPTTTPHVLFSVKVEATPHHVPGETYLMDFRQLAGFTKITSLTVQNHEATGTLHTLNASAEDRSGQIIAAGVRTAIGVASLIAGIPPVTLPASLNQQMMVVCRPEAQRLLTAVAERGADLRTATTRLEGLTEQVNRLTEQARLNTLSEAGKQELTTLIEQQRQASRAVTSAQTRLEREQQKVTSIVQVRWPREFSDMDENVALDEPGRERLVALLERVPLVDGPNGLANSCGTDENNQPTVLAGCLNARLEVALLLDQLVSPGTAQSTVAGEANGVVDPDADEAPGGVFIRPPVRGRLIACQLRPQTPCSESSPLVLLRSDNASIPQLGQLRFLPFRNEMFQNNALSLTLRTDGSIERFEYKETSARGETAATTAAGVVGQLQGLAQAIRTGNQQEEAAAVAELTAERSAALATLQFEIDRLTRQAQLQQLQQPPAVTELATVQAETQQVAARVALLQALLAERKAAAELAALPQ